MIRIPSLQNWPSRVIAGCLALSLGVQPALAVPTITWDGDVDGSWATLGNWSSGALPLTTDVVGFNITGFAGNSITTLGGADRSVRGLEFNANAAANITINAGNTLTTGTSGILLESGTGAHTINAGLTLGGTQTWTNNSANVFTLGGTLSTGGNTVTLAGTGNFSVAGPFAVNGAATVNHTGAGTLTVGGLTTITNALTVNGTGLVSFTGGILNSAGSRTLTINNTNAAGVNLGVISLTEGTTGRTLTVSTGAGATAIAGVIQNGGSGSSALTKNGNGTLVFSGANTFTSTLNLNQGTIRMDVTNTGSNAITMLNAGINGATATLDLNGASYNLGGGVITAGNNNNSGTGTITGTGILRLNATRTFDIRPSTATATELVIETEIANGGAASGVTKTRNGVLVFKGDNSYTGITTLSEGELQLDYTSNVGTKLSNSVALSVGGGVLRLIGNASSPVTETVNGLSITKGSTKIIVNSNGGPGVDLVLGTLAVPSVGGAVDFVLPALGSIKIGAGNTNTHGILGGHLTVNGSAFAMNDGANNLIAATAIEKDDIATWALNENVTDGTGTGYSGTLADSVRVHSLTYNAPATSTVNVSRYLNIGSGGVLTSANIAANAASLEGGTLISSSGQLHFHQFNPTQAFTVSSAIRGNLAVTKNGPGTLILDSASNDFTGETSLNEGVLIVTGGNAIGDTSQVTIEAGTGVTLQLNANETIGSLVGGGADGGGVALGTNTLTVNQTSSQTFSGALTGSGTLIKQGTAGNLGFGLASPGFTGHFIANSGLILFGSNNVANFTAASSVTLNPTGTLLLDDNGSSSGDSDRLNNTAPIIVNGSNGFWAGQVAFRGIGTRNDQNATRSEDVGALNLNSGASYAALDVSSAATNTSGLTELTFDTFNRSNNATLDVRGTNLGASSAGRTRFAMNTAAEAAFMTANQIGGGGAAGNPTISIVPWAIGRDLGSNVLTTGTNLQLGNSLVTYQTGTNHSLRPLNFANEYSTYSAAVATANARESLTEDLTSLSGKTVNALVLNNASTTTAVNVTGSGAGQQLTLTSGALLFTSVDSAGVVTATPQGLTLGGFEAGIRAGPTVSASAGNELIIYQNNHATAGVTIASPIVDSVSGNTKLTKSGLGLLILTGANTYTGTTTLNEGITQIQAWSGIGGSTGSAELVLAGGTLRFSPDFTDSFNRSSSIRLGLGAGGIDTNGANAALNAGFANLGSLAGSFTKSGAGTLTLNAASTATGITTVTGGTLQMGVNQAINNGDLVVNNGALDLQGFSATVGRVTLANAAGSAITGTGTLTSNDQVFDLQRGVISANLAGTSTVVKSTTSTVTLSGSNTYTGITEVRNGVLSFNSIGNVGSGASALGAPTTAENGAIKVGSTTTAGTLSYTGSGHSTDRRLDLVGTTGGGSLDADGTGALVINGAVTNAGAGNKALTLQGSSAISIVNTLNSVLSDGANGTLGLNKSDANTWQINADNTYTGATNVNNGRLRLGHANALGSTTGTTTIAGAAVSAALVLFGNTTYAAETVVMGAKTASTNGASLINESGNNTWTGNIRFATGGGFYGIESQGGKLTLSGIIANETNTSARELMLLGAGDGEVTGSINNGDAGASLEQMSLAMTGAGIWTLSGSNNYTGATTVNSTTGTGTLRLTGTSTLGGAANPVVTVNAGTLDIAGAVDMAFGALILGGGAANTSGVLNIGTGRTITSSGTTYLATNNPLGAVIQGPGIFDIGSGTYVFNVGDSNAATIDLDIQAVLAGNGVFQKTGLGTLRIGGTNNFAGSYDILGGTLVGNLGAAHLILNNSSFGTSGTFALALGTTGNTLEWVNDKSGGLAAVGGDLTVNIGGGTALIWNSTPQFVTGTGELWLNSSGADGVLTWQNSIDFNNTATLQTRVIRGFDNPAVTTDRNVFQSVLSKSGSGDVIVDIKGAGIELTADNSAFNGGATGGLRASGNGRILFTQDNNLGAAANRVILGNGTGGDAVGILEFTGATTLAGTRDIIVSGTGSQLVASGTSGAVFKLDQVISTNNFTLSGTANGEIADLSTATAIVVTKAGTGTWTLTGTSTSGASIDYDLSITGGKLVFGAANAFVGDDITAIAAGATLDIGSFTHDQIDDITISGGTIMGSGTLTFDALNASGTTGRVESGVTLNMGGTARTYSVTNATDVLTIEGNITGTNGMTKSGLGRLHINSTVGYTGTTNIGTGTLEVSGLTGLINSANTITIGDNNGGDEFLVIGSNAVTYAAANPNNLNDLADVTFSGSTSFTFFGPSAASAFHTETMDVLTFSNGRSTLNLDAAVGGQAQLNVSSLVRSNAGTALIRGEGLGGTGADTTRVVVGSLTSFLGSSGAAGTMHQSILPFALGDTSLTGAGTGFLTHDVNGLRLLTDAEYDSSIAGGSILARNVSTAGESVFDNVRINSLRVSGGTTTIASGVDLLVSGGAVLFTGSASIGGAGQLDFNGSPGIISAAQNGTAITATLNSSMAGTGGVTFTSTGNVQNNFILGGNNTFIGGVNLNGGLVRLTHAAALNANVMQDLTLRANVAVNAPILELNGNSIQVRNLAAPNTSSGTIRNGSATPVTLRTYTTTANTFSGNLIDGTGGGALSLTKSGSAVWTIGSNLGYTGASIFEQGQTVLAGNAAGRLTATSSITIGGAAQLRLNSTSTSNSTDRINNAASLTMRGGILEFDVDQAAANYSEQVTNLIVDRGLNTYITDIAAAAQTNAVTFSGALSRNDVGSLIAFQNFGVTGVETGIGTSNQRARVIFSTVPIQTNGIIVGAGTAGQTGPAFAFIFTNAATAANDSLDFATYSADVDAGVAGAQPSITRFTAYNTSGETAWTNSIVARQGSALTTLTANRDVFALKLQDTATLTTAVNLALAGFELNVHSGGIIQSSQANTSITGGTLTAGGTAAGELILMVDDTTATARTLDLSSVIANNRGIDGIAGNADDGVVSLVKAGADNLILGASNTYTGKTVLNGGTTTISSDTSLGAAPATSSAAHLVLNGATLQATQSFTLAATRGIEIGGSGNVTAASGSTSTANNIISISSGTTGNGRTLTYNGPGIQSAPNTIANLTFQSNATAAAPDTGAINATLTSGSNITGSLVIEATDAGSFTLGGTSNVIGRSLVVGSNGAATLRYGVAGGSLRVGSGLPTDTLDIGISAATTITKTGTLNLAGSSSFIANVDLVRIAVATGGDSALNPATITLADDTNTITAATSILISDSASAGAPTVTINLGSGVTTFTTQTFTQGGRKGDADITLGAGGTLNIGGFGERTLNMFIGRQNINTAGFNSSTLNATAGLFSGNFNNLVIGEKSGNGQGGSDSSLSLGSNTGNKLVANTLTLGLMTGTDVAATANTRGWGSFSAAGGSLVIKGDVTMASLSGNGTARGEINLTGGTMVIGGNVLKTDNDRSSAIVTVNGPTAVLDLQDQASGDLVAGTLGISQLVFREGIIQDVASATLDGRSVTSGTAIAALEHALIVRDVTVGFDVNLTHATANKGGVLYEAASAGAGAVINGGISLGNVARTFTVENNTSVSNDLVVNGVISSSGAVTKAGLGTVVFSAANSYVGNTFVNAGTLLVTNSTGSGTGTGTVTVASGATLGGTGIIEGNTILNSGSTLSPGMSAGQLTIQGTVTANLSSTLLFELGGKTTNGLETILSQWQATGSLSGLIGSVPASWENYSLGTSKHDQLLNTHASAAPTVNGKVEISSLFLNGYTPAMGDVFDLMDWSFAGNITGTTDFSALPDLATLGYAGLAWNTELFASNGIIVVVPEPSRVLLLLLGLGMFVLRRRRL